jgi:hypothetical protein
VSVRSDEPRSRSGESLPNSLRRQAGHHCELAAVEVMQVAEKDERAILRTQMPCKQVTHCDDLCIVGGRYRTLTEPTKHPRKATPSSQCLQSAIARDAKEPRFVVANTGKLSTRPKRIVEAVLQEILRQRSVVDQLRQIPADTPLTDNEKLLDGLPECLIPIQRLRNARWDRRRSPCGVLQVHMSKVPIRPPA